MNDGAIRSCDNCQGSWIILLLFILFNTTSVISYVLIIQLKGANMFNMISTLTIPLIQGAFAIPLINYIPDEFNWETIVGLFFIMVGLVRYQNGPHISRDQDEIILSYQYKNGELSSDELFALISSLNFWKDKIGHEIPGAKSQELEKGDHFKSRIVLPHSTPFLFTVESCSKSEKKIELLGFAFLHFVCVRISAHIKSGSEMDP
jgi:prepilin signal peptidase PulO-like enzyme (type II secretory pathway)